MPAKKKKTEEDKAETQAQPVEESVEPKSQDPPEVSTPEIEPAQETQQQVETAKQPQRVVEDENRVSVRKWVFIVGLGILVALIIIGLGSTFYYRSQLAIIPTPTPAPDSTPSPVPTFTPTPSPTVNLSQLTLEVLNGSGVAGAAGRVQDILEEGGFEEIKIGNASTRNNANTTLNMKEGVSDSVFEKIKELLSGYSVVRGDSLAEDSEFDIQIIVGVRS